MWKAFTENKQINVFTKCSNWQTWITKNFFNKSTNDENFDKKTFIDVDAKLIQRNEKQN